MTSEPTEPRRRPVIIVLAVLVVLAALAGGGAWWLGGDDDRAEPLRADSSPSTSAVPEPSESTRTPSPTPSATASCEGPDTIYDPSQSNPPSLLPDCGTQQPVTEQEQRASGLGLGCGGSYPVILYKTDVDDIKASICGETSSGDKLRVVVQEGDTDPRDLDGLYDYRIDGFVGSDGADRYVVLAYNGEVRIRRDGDVSASGPGDWQSLDNENDD